MTRRIAQQVKRLEMYSYRAAFPDGKTSTVALTCSGESIVGIAFGGELDRLDCVSFCSTIEEAKAALERFCQTQHAKLHLRVLREGGRGVI